MSLSKDEAPVSVGSIIAHVRAHDFSHRSLSDVLRSPIRRRLTASAGAGAVVVTYSERLIPRRTRARP